MMAVADDLQASTPRPSASVVGIKEVAGGIRRDAAEGAGC